MRPASPSSRGRPASHRERSGAGRIGTVVLVAIILGLYTRLFLVQVTQIPSESMTPTLLVGDHVLVNRFVYGAELWSEPIPSWLPMDSVGQGDIVVFRRQEGQRFIKRCMARPGDTIDLRAGRVRINGLPADFSIAQTAPSDFGPMTLPLDRFFFLGDHRRQSVDSRNWGGIPRQSLSGQAFLVFWSFRPGQDVAPSDNWGKMISVLDRALAWPTRTRWSRCLKPIR